MGFVQLPCAFLALLARCWRLALEGNGKQNAAPPNNPQEPVRCPFRIALTSYRPGCVRLRTEGKNAGRAGCSQEGLERTPGPEGEPLDPDMNPRTSLN